MKKGSHIPQKNRRRDHAPTAPLPDGIEGGGSDGDLTREQLFTIIRLQIGPLPYPKYDDLNDDAVRARSANQAWRRAAEILVVWHSNCLTMAQVRETVSELWNEEMKNASA